MASTSDNDRRELKGLVHQALTGDRYDPNSIHREKFISDFVADALMDYDLGGYETYGEFRGAIQKFVPPSVFDLDSWMLEKVQQGHYDLPEELGGAVPQETPVEAPKGTPGWKPTIVP